MENLNPIIDRNFKVNNKCKGCKFLMQYKRVLICNFIRFEDCINASHFRSLCCGCMEYHREDGEDMCLLGKNECKNFEKHDHKEEAVYESDYFLKKGD